MFIFLRDKYLKKYRRYLIVRQMKHLKIYLKPTYRSTWKEKSWINVCYQTALHSVTAIRTQISNKDLGVRTIVTHVIEEDCQLKCNELAMWQEWKTTCGVAKYCNGYLGHITEAGRSHPRDDRKKFLNTGC